MTRWIPGILIAGAYAVSLLMLSQLPASVSLDMSNFFPPAFRLPPEQLPRWVIAFGLPTLALLIWLMLHEAPVGMLGRLTWKIFQPFVGKRSTSSGEYEKFAPTYRIFVIFVVSIVLALHAAMLAIALDWPVAPGMIIGIVFGVGLAVIGNVMPRLRPNPIAGVRTPLTMRDPQAWANVHRAVGAAWLIAGVIVLLVGVAAPRYAFLTALALMSLSALAGVGSAFGRGQPRDTPSV
ncbi:MAG TPA: SdpI family protein [Gemmatimonadaceae bacterium]|nr:SdpI family protein [Gemmatimonadaceae bacterium]